MVTFNFFTGTVTNISEFMTGQNGENQGCYSIVTLEDGLGAVVNFVVSPTTYFVDQQIVTVGDRVTGYHDASAPVPLIYPPQYRALIMVKEIAAQNVKVDFFNSELVSSDGVLRLNLSPNTSIVLTNSQPFSSYPGNRNLIVIYGPSTFSIPAQTTPYEIIVWC
ncbi:hypothetical protein CR194_03920 [Salipaludibacillus keqinensis]|uniref:Uncharacterized protein n=1 Tax=Salipaludibacillus keqinensis TaxID=2045207 RepID=A0A323TIP1_9BACI|nr:hypothetical protein [Salipaludibacillus keqinensis]PYZ94688.1 hypothetical protein CR194_03920 [Salipaludibacillus keqinensis]